MKITLADIIRESGIEPTLSQHQEIERIQPDTTEAYSEVFVGRPVRNRRDEIVGVLRLVEMRGTALHGTIHFNKEAPGELAGKIATSRLR